MGKRENSNDRHSYRWHYISQIILLLPEKGPQGSQMFFTASCKNKKQMQMRRLGGKGMFKFTAGRPPNT